MISNKIIGFFISITGFIVIPFVAIIGIPLAILGDTYVALLPSMGEMDSRYSKMICCQTFP